MQSHISLWQSISKKDQTYPTLDRSIEVDVVIIGAGITGVTTAYELTKAGMRVAIVEAHQVGAGTTGYSTGNLYVPVQPYYQEVEKKFNFETAKLIAMARRSAIDYIEKIIKEKQIACHFTRRPWYLYTDDEKKLDFLEKEVNTLKKLECDVEYTTDIPLSFKFKKAARLNNQARFNPMQYVISLAATLKECQLFENSPVISFSEIKDHCIVETKKGKIKAKQVIIATHTPLGINKTQFFTAPYRSYAVAVRVKNDHYPESHFWDLDEPHHSTSTHSIHSDQPELLIVSGNHHKVGQQSNTPLHYQQLDTFLRKNFSVSEVVYQWSAQHYQTADTLPYIGLASHQVKNTYLATGFFADGLLYGTIAGSILSDLILKKENELEKVCCPSRLKLCASMPFLLKENTNVFLQYLKDLPIFSSKSFDEIKKGEGYVVSIEQQKWAVCRDQQNKLHVVSAICPHMKCVVNWNKAENTWDCPCHGSRFMPSGEVIEGPAKHNLEKKES